MNFTKKIGTSFTRSDVEQMKGIEPSYSAWEADVLPLNYIRRTLVLYRAAPRLSSKDFLFLPPDAEYASALAIQHGFMLY